jgi:hypothetical protein
MRTVLALAAFVSTLATGCLGDDAIGDDATGDDATGDDATGDDALGLGRHGLDPTAAAALADEVPDSTHDASCTATVERFVLAAGTCVARTTVRFSCDPGRQLRHWARVGVLCEQAVCAYDDIDYRCDGEVSRSFTVPCAAAQLTGGATFDHPETSVDVSCVSPPLAP